jgi:hypothetical protein
MRNRYNVEKIQTLAGVTYDSGAEQQRHGILLLRQKAGDVSDVQYHTTTVKMTKANITYKPDFIYMEDGRVVYEEVKCRATAAGRWPTIKKLWRHYGPGLLREVWFEGRKGNYRFRTKREIPGPIIREEADDVRSI